MEYKNCRNKFVILGTLQNYHRLKIVSRILYIYDVRTVYIAPHTKQIASFVHCTK